MNLLSFVLATTATVYVAEPMRTSLGHNASQNQSRLKYADDFLKNSKRRPAKVMMVGIWHFDYPNADSHKISRENEVSVLTEKRQKEIVVVVNKLKAFSPTKICLEARSQEKLDKLYESYKKGEQKGNRSEVVQIGLRLASSLNLKKVHAVDATNYAFEQSPKNPDIEKLWDEAHQLDALKYEEFNQAYSKWNTYSNSLLKTQTILQQLIYENDPRNLQRAYGQYMVSGWLKTSNNNGPDALALQWYDRNLRIFNNILKTNPTGADRVLVIFGRSHIPILQHCFQASPEFELKSFYNFARSKQGK